VIEQGGRFVGNMSVGLFVCVLGHLTVGSSPAMAVLLAAIGIALMLLRVGREAS
jgi:hypothetical protein